MQNWNEDLHTAGFIIDATRSQRKLRHYLPAIMVCSPWECSKHRLGQCRWWGKQPNHDHTVTFAVLNGSATSFNNQTPQKRMLMVWRLLIWKVVSRRQHGWSHPWKWRETNVNRQFVGDSSTAQVDLQKSKNEVVVTAMTAPQWPRQSGMQKATCQWRQGHLQC